MEWAELIAEIAEHSRWESGRKQDRSKRTEQDILNAALRVFGRDGISRARIADIAAEAGISTSTLYEYHDSKEDIAYVVPMAYLSKFYEETAELIQPDMTGCEAIVAYLSSSADFARRNADWARLFYLEIWPSVLVKESGLSRTIDDFMRILLFFVDKATAEGELAPKANRYETAAMLLGGVNQVITTWLLYRRPKNLTKAGNAIVVRTLALLQVEKTGARPRPVTAKAKTTRA